MICASSESMKLSMERRLYFAHQNPYWAGTQIRWPHVRRWRTRRIASNLKISFIRREALKTSRWNNASRRLGGVRNFRSDSNLLTSTKKWILKSQNYLMSIQNPVNMIGSSRKDSQIADLAQISRTKTTSFPSKASAARTQPMRWDARTSAAIAIISPISSAVTTRVRRRTRTTKYSRPYSAHSSWRQKIRIF